MEHNTCRISYIWFELGYGIRSCLLVDTYCRLDVATACKGWYWLILADSLTKVVHICSHIQIHIAFWCILYAFLMNILILVLRWNASYVRVSPLTGWHISTSWSLPPSPSPWMSQEISQCCRVTRSTAKSRYLENDRAWLAVGDGDGRGAGYNITVHRSTCR